MKRLILMGVVYFGVLTTISGCANGSGGFQVSDFEGLQSVEVFGNKAINSKLLNNIGVSASKSGESVGITLSADMLLDGIAEEWSSE